jgi:hypothetical protein
VRLDRILGTLLKHHADMVVVTKHPGGGILKGRLTCS